MSVLERLPGSAEWLMARVNAPVALALRKELRRLQRESGVLFAGLWVTTSSGNTLIEHAGEPTIAPAVYPFVSASVPTLESFCGSDGDEHEAVLYRPRLGRRMPQLGLLAADVRGLEAANLYDAIERAGDAVEAILVSVL